MSSANALRETLLGPTSLRKRSPRVPLLQPTAVRPKRGLRAPVLDEGSMDVKPPAELSLVLEFDAAYSSTPTPKKKRS